MPDMRGTGLGEAGGDFEPRAAYVIAGRQGRVGEEIEGSLGLSHTLKQEVIVGGGRDDEQLNELDIQETDLIEVETEDGALLWIKPDELNEVFGDRIAPERGGKLILPTALPTSKGGDGLAERGLINWGIKALRIIGIDAAGELASSIAGRLENSSGLKPGLYHLDEDGRIGKQQKTALGASQEPWLIFLHGTFSSGDGSFGDLFGNGVLWRELQKRYPNRILSLEHQSVTKSPIENARDLAALLPRDAELHLVSHSRGGLIGELLCRAHLTIADGLGGRAGGARDPFDKTELDLFKGEARKDQFSALKQLNGHLKEKRPKVTRFVRVACPAKGTSLASGRLDRWLNMVFDVTGIAMQSVPVLKQVHEGLKDLTMAVANERTDPGTLPGLEAMMPEGSPLISILNRPGVIADADLRIIQGDIEPSGIARRLAIWFTDIFFQGDHDLVVDTVSMAGGLTRLKGALSHFAHGTEVNHFSYFQPSMPTSDLVLEALAADRPRDFETLPAIEAPALVAAHRGEFRNDHPTVFVVPGIAGSHLDVGDSRAWVNVPWLAFGAIGKLAINRRDVRASGLFARYYGELCEFFRRDHNVEAWAYDWRQSIDGLGSDLADDLEAALDRSPNPVRIIAHSMGGLVARQALMRESLRKRFEERHGCRLLMLGTPNKGSWSIPYLLTGNDSLGRNLALLDLTNDLKDILKIVARFPGLLQLLPHERGEVFERSFWSNLQARDPDGGNWELPEQTDLDRARSFAAQYKKAPVLGQQMFYIAGAAPTIDGLDETTTGRIDFTRTHRGDGRVLWDDGRLDGVKTWYVRAAHGDLPREQSAYPAMHEILSEGDTARLSSDEPSLRGESAALPPARPEPVKVYPDSDQLLRNALGSGPRPPADPSIPLLRVRIVNGDLSFARHPILVGHYRGDNINGTEAALDRKLDGRLTKRHSLGLYPTEIGTTEVVLGRNSLADSGVVIGLGGETELTSGRLDNAFSHGLVALGLALEEGDPDLADMGPKGAVSVLIGSGEGGLDPLACLIALLRGSHDAQLRLHNSGARPFDELHIIELREHRAIQAWHGLAQLQKLAEFSSVFKLDGEIVRKDGASRDVPVLRDDSWWRPVQIVERDDDGRKEMEFTSVSGRARAEARIVPDNRSFVENYIAQATGEKTRRAQAASPGRVLFEMLWPNELKEYSADDANLRLQLDMATARIPWELMDDRGRWLERGGTRQDAHKPPAVRFGVIRQLVSARFRRQTAPVTGKRALVIGDPQSFERPSGFSPLPGAASEARAVAAMLKDQGYGVVELIENGAGGRGIEPDEIVQHLFEDSWSIIHIAAHGVVDHAFEDGGRKHTGVVLGHDLVLSASVLEQLPQAPDVAFVNCCHLGKVDPDREKRHQAEFRPELASSIAVQLIKMGAGAVVAAGWAVNDLSAEAFATTFYGQLLGQAKALGMASLRARQAAYDNRAEGDNTWGAYQVYGDPEWLVRGLSANRVNSIERQFSGASEFLLYVDSLQQQAHVARARLTKWLEQAAKMAHKTAIERQWLENADIAAALAGLWTDLGDWSRAIVLLEEARRAKKASLPLQSVEQLSNLKARQAAQLGLKDRTAAIEQIAAISRARAELEQLISIVGETPERLSLVASCWKRQAMLSRGRDKEGSLKKMEESYEQVISLIRQSHGYGAAYAEVNLTVVSMLEGLRMKDPEAHWRKLIAACENNPVKPYDAFDFWGADGQIMNDLCRRIGLLRLEQLPFERAIANDALIAYEKLWKKAGSNHKLMSVIDQFDFMIAVLDDENWGTREAVEPILSGLDQIRDGLKRLRETG